jgi:hypothetical protein
MWGKVLVVMKCSTLKEYISVGRNNEGFKGGNNRIEGSISITNNGSKKPRLIKYCNSYKIIREKFQL